MITTTYLGEGTVQSTEDQNKGKSSTIGSFRSNAHANGRIVVERALYGRVSPYITVGRSVLVVYGIPPRYSRNYMFLTLGYKSARSGIWL